MLVANTAGVFGSGWPSDACIGAACMLVPAIAFTQTASLNASIAWLVVAMFPLVSNLIGLGFGTTVVALITDRAFGSPLDRQRPCDLASRRASALRMPPHPRRSRT